MNKNTYNVLERITLLNSITEYINAFATGMLVSSIFIVVFSRLVFV